MSKFWAQIILFFFKCSHRNVIATIWMKGKRESLQCQKSRLAFNLTHYKRSRSRALPCNRGDVELALRANWPLKSSERDCKKEKKNTVFCFFFFGNPVCPGQFTRTTTNFRTHWIPCKPSRQVRHRGDNRHARWDSNPYNKGKETLSFLLATSLGVKKKTVNVYLAVEGIINFCTDENIMLKISDFVERLFFD